MIPYGRQEVTQADIDAVVSTLTSDFLTQGPVVPAFEKAIATYCGVRHAVAVNSATSGLHIACLALGLGQGDWLWTSTITFVASANCALYCGAQVDFVDIDDRTYNLSVPALQTKLERAEREGRLPKIVVAVHLCGQPCDMRAIRALSVRYGFKVIEDASHAIGARYLGEPVGNCAFSDVTVFSFHPVKIITSAEGGMVTTNDAAIARSLELYRSHGVTRDPTEMDRAPDGPWYYQQIALGYNYRLTDLQAALGLSQAGRIDEYVTRRHALARRYDALLATLPVRLAWQHPDGYSGLHLYVVRVPQSPSRTSHRRVFEVLRERGIGVNLHYIPVHTQPHYKRFGYCDEDFPNAMRYYAEAISLPMYATLSEAQQDKVVLALEKAMHS